MREGTKLAVHKPTESEEKRSLKLLFWLLAMLIDCSSLRFYKKDLGYWKSRGPVSRPKDIGPVTSCWLRSWLACLPVPVYAFGCCGWNGSFDGSWRVGFLEAYQLVEKGEWWSYGGWLGSRLWSVFWSRRLGNFIIGLICRFRLFFCLSTRGWNHERRNDGLEALRFRSWNESKFRFDRWH